MSGGARAGVQEAGESQRRQPQQGGDRHVVHQPALEQHEGRPHHQDRRDEPRRSPGDAEGAHQVEGGEVAGQAGDQVDGGEGGGLEPRSEPQDRAHEEIPQGGLAVAVEERAQQVGAQQRRVEVLPVGAEGRVVEAHPETMEEQAAGEEEAGEGKRQPALGPRLESLAEVRHCALSRRSPGPRAGVGSPRRSPPAASRGSRRAPRGLSAAARAGARGPAAGRSRGRVARRDR